MRVLIQWATATASDWVEYNFTSISQIRAVPKKPVPSDASTLDNAPGWISAVNIQGIEFTGYDHIGFALSGGALVVTCWNDDPEDFPVGTRWGQVWALQPPAPDPAFGGQVNTRQSVIWYGEAQSDPALAGVPVLPYAQMVKPHQNNTIHGVWMSDGQWAALEGARSQRGWREWVP